MTFSVSLFPSRVYITRRLSLCDVVNLMTVNLNRQRRVERVFGQMDMLARDQNCDQRVERDFDVLAAIKFCTTLTELRLKEPWN